MHIKVFVDHSKIYNQNQFHFPWLQLPFQSILKSGNHMKLLSVPCGHKSMDQPENELENETTFKLTAKHFIPLDL